MKEVDLHSTIFILKQEVTKMYNFIVLFTFYNIYIKTGAEKTLAVQ